MNGVKERELINEIRERNIEKSSGLRKNVLMSEFTTFRVGGPAKLFFEPEDENILIEVLKLNVLYGNTLTSCAIIDIL